MRSRAYLEKYEKLYDTFDKGHDRKHLDEVRSFAVKLAHKYCKDKVELVYVGATLHDIGLSVDRKNHEIEGVKLAKQDSELTADFSDKELAEIYESIAEHRASNGKPVSVVAKIVSDSDKVAADTNRVFQRAYDWGIKNLPQLNHSGQLIRAAYHLKEKFGKNGMGTRLYFEESIKKQSETFTPIFEALKNYDFEQLESFLGTKEANNIT